jgi:hypothetical protein
MKSAILPLLFLAGACSAPPYPAIAIDDDAEQTAQVVVADASLQAIVRVGQPLVERVQPDGYLRIVVPIRNIDDKAIQALVQASFLDVQRRTVDDVTNRQVLLLPPGGTVNFSAVSRHPLAMDFVVRIGWNQ